MEDIDRTFLKLKRPTFEFVRNKVNEAAKNGGVVASSVSYELGLMTQYFHVVENLGWTVEEFNRELNKIP